MGLDLSNLRTSQDAQVLRYHSRKREDISIFVRLETLERGDSIMRRL